MAKVIHELSERDVRNMLTKHYREQGREVESVRISYDRPPNANQFDPGTGLSVVVIFRDRTS